MIFATTATPRWPVRAAIATCALGGVLFGAAAALYVASIGIERQRVLSAASLAVFSVAGTLVVSRQPRNPIGWIFCVSALATGVSAFTDAYAWYSLEGHGSRPLGEVAAAIESAGWVPTVMLPAAFLPLLFPDGHLLSRRWRWVARGAALAIAVGFTTQLTHHGELEDFPGVENPLGIDHPAVEGLGGVALLAIFAVLIAASASLILRFRRARGQERQQIKWLAWAGAVAAVAVIAGSTLGYAYAGAAVANVVIVSSILALPAATGVAILRYRLYDVDIVINRTLVYGALTVTLGATYLGLVLLAGPAVGRSNLTIAASTLAVAGLFRPLRARIQSAVDRRFYRNRYDAGLTLSAFGSRLRDEVDLETLGSDLRGVVRETVQPTSVTLWLRTER